MKYTLLLHYDENGMDTLPPEVQQQGRAAFMAYAKALQDAGLLVGTDWLRKSTETTTVSVKNGARQVQDGPFADSREQMGGYFIIDVPDLDQAIDWAAKCPAAHYGAIEIRTSFLS